LSNDRWNCAILQFIVAVGNCKAMIVDELAACLQSPSIIEGGKRAAVGIVLRRPEGSGDGALSPTDIGTVNVKDLEVLFILRAINENDRWSGQVSVNFKF